MCGIAGIVDFSGSTPDRRHLERMGEVMRYRGPDAQGVLAEPGIGLSHRRLAIIDLSDGGRQPMCNEDGSLWLVFNGEIYNYRELSVDLQRRGHRFRSATDSEVLLHAFEEYGEDCLGRLNGMFAFALWDSKRRDLFLARDRIGIKPLYYCTVGHRFLFASEVKSLLVDPSVNATPSEHAIEQYLLRGFPLDDETWYRGVRQLLPGHCARVRDGRVEVRKYWDFTIAPDGSKDLARAVEELRATVEDAVRIHLRSDVPVGAHLSGGLDSSSIVALASRGLGRGIHTFSSAYEEGAEFDERKYIDIVSREFGTQHHAVVPGYEDLPKLLPRLIWLLDEPVVGPAVLAMYRVSELAAAHKVKVVNGGQGADELFGGYGTYFGLAASNIVRGLRRGVDRPPLGEVLRLPQYMIRGGWVTAATRRLRRARQPVWLRAGDLQRREREYYEGQRLARSDLGPFELGSYLQVKHYLRALLQPEDRMSMCWSVESRVPLLDHRIVELAGRLPFWHKVGRGVSKLALREAMRGIVPDAVVDRRDKKGYPVPLKRWFARELRGYLWEQLGERPLLSGDLVDPQVVRQMIKEHDGGARDHSGALWLILNTELWYRGVAGGWEGVKPL